MAEKEETPSQQQLELAYERTILAAERNLMAWIRTSLTLIAFGFAIEKIFFANDSHMVQYNNLMFRESGLVGLVLVVLGVIVINIAMFQHIKIQKNLEQRMNKHGNKWPLGIFTSVALQLIGVLISIFIVSRIA